VWVFNCISDLLAASWLLFVVIPLLAPLRSRLPNCAGLAGKPTPGKGTRTGKRTPCHIGIGITLVFRSSQLYVGTRLQAWVCIIATLCRQFAAGCWIAERCSFGIQNRKLELERWELTLRQMNKVRQDRSSARLVPEWATMGGYQGCWFLQYLTNETKTVPFVSPVTFLNVFYNIQ